MTDWPTGGRWGAVGEREKESETERERKDEKCAYWISKRTLL